VTNRAALGLLACNELDRQIGSPVTDDASSSSTRNCSSRASR